MNELMVLAAAVLSGLVAFLVLLKRAGNNCLP